LWQLVEPRRARARQLRRGPDVIAAILLPALVLVVLFVIGGWESGDLEHKDRSAVALRRHLDAGARVWVGVIESDIKRNACDDAKSHLAKLEADIGPPTPLVRSELGSYKQSVANRCGLWQNGSVDRRAVTAPGAAP
jgi:hypothetical protein